MRRFSGDVAEFSRIIDALQNSAVSTVHRLMHSVLEANTTISITCAVETRQHLELYILVASRLGYNVSL